MLAVERARRGVRAVHLRGPRPRLEHELKVGHGQLCTASSPQRRLQDRRVLSRRLAVWTQAKDAEVGRGLVLFVSPLLRCDRSSADPGLVRALSEQACYKCDEETDASRTFRMMACFVQSAIAESASGHEFLSEATDCTPDPERGLRPQHGRHGAHFQNIQEDCPCLEC
jgi:hypothetical protein